MTDTPESPRQGQGAATHGRTGASDAQAASDPEMAAAVLAEARRRTDALALFSRRVAHDLSNFLTVIRTYSELMQADLPPDHPNRADLDEIAQAADITVSYVQRTSAFARALASRVSTFPLDPLVSSSVHGADYEDLGPLQVVTQSGVSVSGPAPSLSEAIQELTRNAREASPPNTTVFVRTRVEVLPEAVVRDGVPIDAGTWAVVEIEDRGAGLPLELASSAFDPFVTGKTGVRGAGFGLTMARTAAWACGGELTVGRADGGTVARLYLPPAAT